MGKFGDFALYVTTIRISFATGSRGDVRPVDAASAASGGNALSVLRKNYY